jgi:hypothetical protein
MYGSFDDVGMGYAGVAGLIEAEATGLVAQARIRRRLPVELTTRANNGRFGAGCERGLGSTRPGTGALRIAGSYAIQASGSPAGTNATRIREQ